MNKNTSAAIITFIKNSQIIRHNHKTREKGKQLTFTKTYDHTNTDIQHPAPQKDKDGRLGMCPPSLLQLHAI
jgi:hypothetical protein